MEREMKFWLFVCQIICQKETYMDREVTFWRFVC